MQVKPAAPLVPPSSSEVARNRLTDPILGGGALKVEVGGDGGGVGGDGEERTQRARAAGKLRSPPVLYVSTRAKSTASLRGGGTFPRKPDYFLMIRT